MALAYRPLLGWLEAGASGAQTVGPFGLKSPDIYGMVYSYFTEFIGVSGSVIIIFGLFLLTFEEFSHVSL